jgi:hypothetical protein
LFISKENITVVLEIAATLTGLFFGTLLERYIIGSRIKPSLFTGSLLCLIGFLGEYITRGSGLAHISTFIVFLGVPALSNGILLVAKDKRNRNPGKPAV